MTAVELSGAQICVIAGGLALAYAEERSFRDRAIESAKRYSMSRDIFAAAARAAERRMAEVMSAAEALPDFGQRTFASELGDAVDSAASA